MNMLLLKLSHPVVAGVAQLALYFLLGNPWIGGLLALLFFCGREHAQAEYRYIEAYGQRFKTPAQFAEFHYNLYGQVEQRPQLGSWDEYFAANADVQAEYAKLSGTRSRMPLWGGFDPRVWSLHSILGVVLPAVASAALGWFL